MYTSRAGGLPPSSNQPPQQGQPTAPPTFERPRRNSNASASDNLGPLPKKARRSDAFGAPAQPTTASTQSTGHTQPSVTASLQHGPRPTAPTTVMLPPNPVAPVNSSRQLIQQRLPNRSLLPTPTPQMTFTLTSGEVGMRGMAAAGSQGGQATSTRTHASSRHGPQTTMPDPSAPRASTNNDFQPVRPRLLLRIPVGHLPTQGQGQAQPMDFPLTASTSAPTHAPPRSGPQATTQTRVSGLAGGSAASHSNDDVFLRNLLASPVAPMTLPVTPTTTTQATTSLPSTRRTRDTPNVPSQGMQTTSATTHSPSGRAPQTRSQTQTLTQARAQAQAQASNLRGPSAPLRSVNSMLDDVVRGQQFQPMPGPGHSSTASTATPLVARQLPATGTMQRTTQTATTGSSLQPSVGNNDNQLIHMLAQPYVDAELAQLQSVRPSYATSTVTPQVAMPRPSSAGAQDTPFVPAPPVHIAPAATAQPISSAAPSTFPPLSSLGVTAEDLNQRDMMDEYLGGMSTAQIPASSASNPVQNLPLPGQMNSIGNPQPLPPAGQSAGPGPSAWVNPLPQPLPMSSAGTVMPASGPTLQNPPGV